MGTGQGQLRHHVGWGDDGGDHERDDDEVTTEVLQLLNAHHPMRASTTTAIGTSKARPKARNMDSTKLR